MINYQFVLKCMFSWNVECRCCCCKGSLICTDKIPNVKIPKLWFFDDIIPKRCSKMHQTIFRRESSLCSWMIIYMVTVLNVDLGTSFWTDNITSTTFVVIRRRSAVDGNYSHHIYMLIFFGIRDYVVSLISGFFLISGFCL